MSGTKQPRPITQHNVAGIAKNYINHNADLTKRFGRIGCGCQLILSKKTDVNNEQGFYQYTHADIKVLRNGGMNGAKKSMGVVQIDYNRTTHQIIGHRIL